MGGRIITLQRQARELGRLRAGTTEPAANGRTRPARSRTWILTTHQREYLDAAAEAWGGEVQRWTPQGGGAEAWRLITEAEAIDAILPPGDPLSQHYEMWSKGGCQRRCDGQTEQLSNRPCLCLAQFGEEFHLQKPEDACRPHTRLNVVLPDVPDLGVWRVETKGFYAANEIAASIDLIRNATGGAVMVPVRLRIEPRKRVAQGKTKQYPVIVVEIRGATAGQILGGAVPSLAIDGAPQRQAIASTPASAPVTAEAPQRDWLTEIQTATTADRINGLLADMKTAGVRDRTLVDAWNRRAREIEAATSAGATAEPSVEGEVEPEPDAVWASIIAAAPEAWGTTGLEQRVCDLLGKSSADANGFELQRFLVAVKNGEVK
jgi:hypothetical protein